jgi:glycosyltransferase involved in cell wall biosynthesis
MRKPILTIFYQYNPWRATIGGIQTIINSFIKYAPDEFEVRLVGTTDNPSHLISQWQETEFLGKRLVFMPLVKVHDDNVRKVVPTTLKYTLALIGQHFESDFLHFHRLEPTLVSLPWLGDKTLFIHNDIYSQIQSKESQKGAILWQKIPWAYFAVERLLVRQFTQIFSCNSNSVDLYRQRYPAIADRVSLIKNTVDGDIFYPLSLDQRNQQRQHLAQKLGLSHETKFILFAGRLHPQKDPLLLLQSMAALNQPNVQLLIAGDGELAGDIRSEIARLGLSQSVTMLGAISQAELANLHRLSSAFILTSIYEGLPLVVLEALLCGTPVITTQCGETPNLLTTNSGIVCQERSPMAIADALHQILSHPNLYPSAACVEVAKPYSAYEIVTHVYADMLQRWQTQNSVTLCS